jgi:hypothetical protein
MSANLTIAAHGVRIWLRGCRNLLPPPLWRREGGCLFDSAELIPPSRLARIVREPTSPIRGEVTGAS